MAIEEIVEKIIGDAKKEAQKIKREARKEANKLLVEAEAEAEKLRREYLTQASQKAEAEKERILTQARLKSRNLLLAKKQELIEEAFQIAEERLLKLSPSQKLNFLKNLILKASENGDEEIVLSSVDRKLVDASFLKEVNDGLKKKKKLGQVKLSSEARLLKGGVVLKKGSLEINASLENLLLGLRAEAEGEIIRLLMGEK